MNDGRRRVPLLGDIVLKKPERELGIGENLRDRDLRVRDVDVEALCRKRDVLARHRCEKRIQRIGGVIV